MAALAKRVKFLWGLLSVGEHMGAGHHHPGGGAVGNLLNKL